MNKLYVLIFTIFFISACSNDELCNNERAFDSWYLQQTWYMKSNTREHKNLGVIFDATGGYFWHPSEIKDFRYCVQDMTIFLKYGHYGWFNNIFGKKVRIEILDINEETMTLLFQDGTKFTYYRNETIK